MGSSLIADFVAKAKSVRGVGTFAGSKGGTGTPTLPIVARTSLGGGLSPSYQDERYSRLEKSSSAVAAGFSRLQEYLEGVSKRGQEDLGDLVKFSEAMSRTLNALLENKVNLTDLGGAAGGSVVSNDLTLGELNARAKSLLEVLGSLPRDGMSVKDMKSLGEVVKLLEIQTEKIDGHLHILKAEEGVIREFMSSKGLNNTEEELRSLLLEFSKVLGVDKGKETFPEFLERMRDVQERVQRLEALLSSSDTPSLDSNTENVLKDLLRDALRDLDLDAARFEDSFGGREEPSAKPPVNETPEDKADREKKEAEAMELRSKYGVELKALREAREGLTKELEARKVADDKEYAQYRLDFAKRQELVRKLESSAGIFGGLVRKADVFVRGQEGALSKDDLREKNSQGVLTRMFGQGDLGWLGEQAKKFKVKRGGLLDRVAGDYFDQGGTQSIEQELEKKQKQLDAYARAEREEKVAQFVLDNGVGWKTAEASLKEEEKPRVSMNPTDNGVKVPPVSGIPVKRDDVTPKGVKPVAVGVPKSGDSETLRVSLGTKEDIAADARKNESREIEVIGGRADEILDKTTKLLDKLELMETVSKERNAGLEKKLKGLSDAVEKIESSGGGSKSLLEEALDSRGGDKKTNKGGGKPKGRFGGLGGKVGGLLGLGGLAAAGSGAIPPASSMASGGASALGKAGSSLLESGGGLLSKGSGLVKGAGLVGTAMAVGGGVMDYAKAEDGKQRKEAVGSTAGSMAGGWAGATAGMSAGAAVGGAIGSAFFGVGAVPGAAVGGFIGGIAGAMGGTSAGGAAGTWLADSFVNVSDAIPDSVVTLGSDAQILYLDKVYVNKLETDPTLTEGEKSKKLREVKEYRDKLDSSLSRRAYVPEVADARILESLKKNPKQTYEAVSAIYTGLPKEKFLDLQKQAAVIKERDKPKSALTETSGDKPKNEGEELLAKGRGSSMFGGLSSMFSGGLLNTLGSWIPSSIRGVGERVGEATFNAVQDVKNVAKNVSNTDLSAQAGVAAARLAKGEGLGSTLSDTASKVATGKVTKQRIGEHRDFLLKAMTDSGITDGKERAALMAQVGNETGGFTTFSEGKYTADGVWKNRGKQLEKLGVTKEQVDAAYKANPNSMYEFMYGDKYREAKYRMGNDAEGDGERYKGRGYLQVTGKNNYRAMSQKLFGDDRLLKNPELMESPEVSAKAAMIYWKESGAGKAAVAGDFDKTSAAVNAGNVNAPLSSVYGLENRRKLYAEELARAGVTDVSQSPKFAPMPGSLDIPGQAGVAPAGLKIKSQEAIAGGNTHQGTFDLAKSLQDSMGSDIKHFAAFNDKYHQGTNSDHAKGLKFDVSLNDPKRAKQVIEQIHAQAKEAGVSVNVLDEYAKLSARGTGGHLDVGFKNAQDAQKYAEYMKGKLAAKQVEVAKTSAKSDAAQIASLDKNAGQVVGDAKPNLRGLEANGVSLDVAQRVSMLEGGQDVSRIQTVTGFGEAKNTLVAQNQGDMSGVEGLFGQIQTALSSFTGVLGEKMDALGSGVQSAMKNVGQNNTNVVNQQGLNMAVGETWFDGYRQRKDLADHYELSALSMGGGVRG